MSLVPGYKFRLQLVPTLLSLGAVYFFASLGAWQVRRLGESEARQAEFLQHIEEPPLSVAAATATIYPSKGMASCVSVPVTAAKVTAEIDP